MDKKFSEFEFAPQLTENIKNLGYENCTPIQTDAMPIILKGQDVAGLAQTGTGKTAAYLIPLLHRIITGDFADWKARQFILVLVPTRELAEQVLETFQKLSAGTGLRGTAVYGGVGYDKQKEALAEGHEFIFATPGRLIDLYKEHVADLKQVRAVVFDEADRLFDMGFKDDIRFVLSRIPRERQMLVFSATLNLDVINTCYEFGSHPVELNLSRDKATAENVHHVIMHVGQNEKPMYLLTLLQVHKPKQVIVFTNFKNQVERVADFLTKNQMPAMAISSLMTQAQRNKV
ncbi:MAG: DEAD/DEAH box helicase, partial [Bdellovibrionota bacterium]